MTTESKALTEFAVGDRVKLIRPVDRFPFFGVDEGATGTVSIVEPNCFAVRMDETIDGAEEWDNAIVWDMYDLELDDPMADIQQLDS